MSAWMCGTDHIDLLVSIAYADYMGGPSRLTVTYQGDSTTWRVLLSEKIRALVASDESCISGTNLGKILMLENAASLVGRYAAADVNELGEYADQINDYRFQPITLDEIPNFAAVAFNAIASYEYQSSCLEKWDSSEARAWCKAIRFKLSKMIAAQDHETTGWDFNRKKVGLLTRSK